MVDGHWGHWSIELWLSQPVIHKCYFLASAFETETNPLGFMYLCLAVIVIGYRSAAARLPAAYPRSPELRQQLPSIVSDRRGRERVQYDS